MPYLPLKTLDIDITERCPLACDYCYKTNKTPRTISPEEAASLIDWFLPRTGGNRLVKINFFGGEPLAAVERMKEIVTYARQKAKACGKQMKFSGPTNLVIVNDRVLDFLKRESVHMFGSVDGAPESHDVHRKFPDGRGSSEIVHKNARTMLSAFPNTRARMTALPDLAYRFNDDILFLASLGFQRIQATPAYDMEWSQEQYGALFREMRAVSDFYVDRFRSGSPVSIEHIETCILRMIKRDWQRFPCGAGRSLIAYDLDGNLFPCHRFSGEGSNHPLCMGTLDSFDDSVRLPYLNFNPYRDVCDECFAAETCGFSCIYSNFQVHGDITVRTDAFCQFKRAAFIEAQRIDRILRREKNALYLKRFYSPAKKSPGAAGATKPGPKKTTSSASPGTWTVHT